MNQQPSKQCKEVQVRPATAADAETIVRFNRAMALETEQKDLPADVANAGVESALADPDRARYYIAEIDGEPAGQTMVTVEWSDWRSGFFWWIQSVYVARKYRCRGVFRALHAHIRAEAFDRTDVCGLRLYVHRDNAHALNTYQKLGMSPTDYLLLEEDWSCSRPPT